ncbi:MAG: hypothetical protein ACOZF2_08270 [Thermodesulfobacteriota bacterium]
MNHTCLLQDEAGLRQLLREWQGDKDGRFEDLKTGRVVNSHLLVAQEALAAVGQKHKDMVAMARRAGRPASDMQRTPELIREELQAQAVLDIRMEEIDWLLKAINKRLEGKRKEDEALVLLHGPMGSTQGADPPRAVDGQPVRWDEKDGNFLIDCPTSPYHKMRLPNYYADVVKPWRAATRQAYDEAHKNEIDLEASEGSRKLWAEKAQMILRTPLLFVPMPPRPKEE